MENTREIIRKFAMALNNINESYCSDASKISVKKSMLWLMYTLDDGKVHSQKSICQEWGFPKTTLNTTIKQAESEGYLVLTPILGKRREMNICLTEAGEEYANQILASIYEAEEKAMKETMKRYSLKFIDALDYFSICIKSAFENKLESGEKNKT